jgi:Zeta toxin.
MAPSTPRPRHPKQTSVHFSFQHSTDSLYETSEEEYYGPYAHIRRDLDYKYHNNYTKHRQWLQDSIIDKLLNEIVTGDHDDKAKDFSLLKEQAKASPMPANSPCAHTLCSVPLNPWLIYVAGTEKSNRSFTIKCLLEDSCCWNSYDHDNQQESDDDVIEIVRGLPRFPILGFVLVDSREIRSLLPEYQCYLQQLGQELAAKLTQCETGYISEILTRAALQAGTNVLVYGGLRDSEWYKHYFTSLKRSFHNLKIAVLHIVGPQEEVTFECQRISKAVEELIPIIHFCCKLKSGKKSEDIQILSDDITWSTFQAQFIQERAFVAETIHKLKVKHRGELGFINEFSSQLSTEENYQSSSMFFYGPYAHIRERLDYSYHKNYKRERQMLQDAIINEIMNKAKVVDANSGEVCTTPTEPFLVFTAGAMGAGKSYTLHKLHQKGRFPLSAFVVVDPDEIRQSFPEYSLYVSQNPLKAGEMTRKEAGYIVEILTLAALQAGKNALVDGSLRDWEWYSSYFDRLRKEYPTLKIALLHIVAPKEAIFARAKVSFEVWFT